MDFEMHGEPLSGLLTVNDGVLNDAGRLALREQLAAGELSELVFSARVWRDGPNRNGFRFRESDLPAFGASFAGQPFLRDHDTGHIDSREGTIVSSQFVDGGFVQDVRLTSERGIRDFVQGRIDRFSVGWFYDGITCSVCNQDWFGSACDHWPLRRYQRRDASGKAEEVLCELIFEHPEGKETSAINAPAVSGTRLLSQLCDRKLDIQKQKKEQGEETMTDHARPETQAELAPAFAGVTPAKAGAAEAALPAQSAPPAPQSNPVLAEAGVAPAPPAYAGVAPETDNALVDALLRAARNSALTPAYARVALVNAQPVPASDPAPAPPSADAGATAQADAWLSYLRKQAVDAGLRASGLPAEAREAVRAMLGDDGDPAKLDAAIAQQKAVIAVSQRVVEGLGRPLDGGRIGGMMTGREEFDKAFEALLAGNAPPSGVRPLSGLREAYILLSGDYDMQGLFRRENIGLAAVDSATMSGLVADTLNKRVVNLFQEYPRWWEPIVTVERFTTLQKISWITLGGVGELPTVEEGAAFTEMTWDDQTETAAWLKKGGYLGLTLEAIDRDDTRRLQAVPRALAQAAYLSLAKAIARIFTTNSATGPTMSDGLSLFHASHTNLGNSALSYTSWTTTRAAMRKQTELNSGERLGGLVVPKFMLVPPDLEGTALTVLMSEGQPATANNDANPWADGEGHEARKAAAQRRVIVVDLWTDPNNWATVADPRLYPSIGLGYRFGDAPQLYSLADSNQGLMFTNDVMPVKVRFFFAVGPTDWRGLYQHVV